MKSILHVARLSFFVGFIATVAACAPKIRNSPGPAAHINAEAIVGGADVPKQSTVSHSVVALIAVHEQGEALCTGTLLSDEIVLTAAHCVDDATNLAVVFSLNVKSAGPENIRHVDRFLQHPLWLRQFQKDRAEDGRSDLALLHFSGGVPATYSPVTLAEKDFVPTRGAQVLFVGYGVKNGPRESGAGRLRETQSVVIDAASRTEIVTDGHEGSVCFGDSGGPAFAMQGATLVQWGVASSVTNRACNEASIHTLISPYRTWIYESMMKLSGSAR